MPRLIHLNGPPGVGKSTLARRYQADHPGVLNCDIDLLRTMVGGWREDFGRSGELIRPVALSMIGAHLCQGQDVLLPQMLADPDEIDRFQAAASRAGADFVQRWLVIDPERAVARFHQRGNDIPGDSGFGTDDHAPWHVAVRAIVAEQGGDTVLRDWYAALEAVRAQLPNHGSPIDASKDPEATYQALLASLA